MAMPYQSFYLTKKKNKCSPCKKIRDAAVQVLILHYSIHLTFSNRVVANIVEPTPMQEGHCDGVVS